MEEDLTAGTWFSVDNDKEGNELDLAKSLLIVNGKATSSAGNMYYQAYKANQFNANYVVMNLKVPNNNTILILCERLNDRVIRTTSSNNAINNCPGASMGLKYSDYPINGCNFQLGAGTLTGTTYEFWGVDR